MNPLRQTVLNGGFVNDYIWINVLTEVDRILFFPGDRFE